MVKDQPIRPLHNGILRFLFSEPPSDDSSPAIFLDRDGVINKRVLDGYVTEWSQFEFVDGIKGTLAELTALRLPIVVVSNQAGIGKGLFSVETLAEITGRFVSELQAEGARVDAVYYCPHVSEARCSCRKPSPNLLWQASRDWRINLPQSVLVGDSESDLQAARVTHCRAILLADRNGHSLPDDAVVEPPPITVQSAGEIAAGVRRLLQENES
jgi:D-glycero-D-manno-heptose 1,7-bisphosphate phosphatase